ncbi:hypothetical protein C5S32_10505 [ANME-1 cluster archaeon GoMg1]|nr:hypothetical protein [ANME-1 cluster archaeon GoMg1]
MVYQRLSKALSGLITHFLSLKLFLKVLSKTLCKKKEPVLRKKLIGGVSTSVKIRLQNIW